MKKLMKLYLMEHREIFTGVLIAGIGISGLLSLLEKNMNYAYLGVLYLFIFLLTAGIHFYRNIPFYQSLLSKIENEEDIFLDGNTALADVERNFIKQTQKVYTTQLFESQKQNQNYKLLMNQWVHQMKTPLSVISMLAQDNAYVLSDDLIEETDRMDYLLNQILQLIRMENVKNDFIVERCRLQELVKIAVNDQKKFFIQKEVFPKIDIDDSIFVYTDKKWFPFVTGQLLNNAVKYSESGNSVVIHAEVKDQKAVLSIQDFGIGIIPEDTARIYDFCYTGSNGREKQKESSGLGLYLTKNILDYLNHKIEMSSIPGKGTVFTIYLNADKSMKTP